MNAEMNFKGFEKYDVTTNFETDDKKDMGISEDCNFSVYSMLTVAGGILLAIGAVLYSIVAM